MNENVSDGFDDLIDEARRCFVRTQNPLWVWQVIAICTGRYLGHEHAPRTIPDWVARYLNDAATAFLDMGMLNDPSKRPKERDYRDDADGYQQALQEWRGRTLDTKKTDKLALEALLLRTGSGRNQFSLYKSDTDSILTAIAADIWGRQEAPERMPLKLSQSPTDKRIGIGRKIRPRLWGAKVSGSEEAE